MPISAVLPSEFRLIPARADLNAVPVFRRRNFQIGTAYFQIIQIRGFIFFMSKIAFFILIVVLAAMNFACSTSETTNTNQANLPPEFSNKPIMTNANSAPGINPNNINVAPNPNGTPTPGIPDPRNVNVKPNLKGTPTPGIPDEKSLKQQMNNTSPGDVNSPKSITDSDKTVQPKTNTKP